MKVANIKEIKRGNLICKFDLEFDQWGLTIRECMLMNGKNGLWVSFPSRQYEKDGMKKWYDLIVFEKEKRNRITDQVVDELKSIINS